MLCTRGAMGLSSPSNQARGGTGAALGRPLPSPRAGTKGCLKSKNGVGKVPAHFNFQLNLY